MTYYGITSNDTGEKVFAVIAITLFVVWLINPAFLGDTFFEDEDLAQSKNLNIKKTAILLILVLSGTSFMIFSHTVSNFAEKVERKESPVSIYVTKTYKENSIDFLPTNGKALVNYSALPSFLLQPLLRRPS